jgi:hypothetical protein
MRWLRRKIVKLEWSKGEPVVRAEQAQMLGLWAGYDKTADRVPQVAGRVAPP